MIYSPMHEIHPFPDFVPPGIKHLLLGSFIARDGLSNPNYDWYYSNGRNQFWRIIEQVYDITLSDKASKQELFTQLKIGIADLIRECDRALDNSMDTSLQNKIYNQGIIEVFQKHELQTVYFTSQFVEKEFRVAFPELVSDYPEVKLVRLPSPSPRYATISLAQKAELYTKLLPTASSP